MKLICNNQLCSIAEKVTQYKKELKNNRIFTISSPNPLDHIACYVAWKEVGGNILVKSPFLPKQQSEYVDQKIKTYEYENSINFLTSGTTGIPKIIVNTPKQLENIEKMSLGVYNWNSNTSMLSIQIPPFNSGFWHMFALPLVKSNSKIIFTSKETFLEDMNQQDVNISLFVAPLLEQLRTSNVKIDFSKFDMVYTGASQVTKKMSKYVFDHGGKAINHIYGATEIGTPILNKLSYIGDEFVEYLELKSNCINSEFKLVDDELWIKSPSVCENINECSHSDNWLKTGDLWEQNGDLIKFTGRSNEVLKINGYKTSLLLIEKITQEYSDLGETLAKVNVKWGSEYIELFYTNKNSVIDKNKLKSIFEPFLSKYSIPKKYTYIESIPKTALGKKIR
jgi:acyl-coenzyme A synthetase/AMP-(fatty) acid ligase